MGDDYDGFHAPDPRERTDPRIRALKLQVEESEGTLLRKVRGVATAIGLFGAIVTPVGAFSLWLISEAKAQGADAGHRANAVRDELEAHKRESVQAHLQMRTDVHEVQQDVRALYKAMMTGRPSARLEAAPDGGAP